MLRADTDFGGYLTAELLGLPHACVANGAANAIDPGWLSARLDMHDTRLGLPPDRSADALYRYAYRDFMPSAFGFARRPIPHTRSYRLALPDHPGEAMTPWVADLPADRPLILAPPVPLPSRMPRGWPTSPSRRWPSCGLNSVRESLQCGVPLVRTPLGADQPHIAERCAEYGFGVVGDPATVTADPAARAIPRRAGDAGICPAGPRSATRFPHPPRHPFRRQ